MINRFTGQLDFEDGLCFQPFERIDRSGAGRVRPSRVNSRREPAILLGTHASEFGLFEVAYDLDSDMALCRIGLSCPSGVTDNPTRWMKTLDDIIQQDLGGETSFTWGAITIVDFVRSNLSHLIITYSTATQVERPHPPPPRRLSARTLPRLPETPLSPKGSLKAPVKSTQE